MITFAWHKQQNDRTMASVLLCDSGGTKADWALVDSKGEVLLRQKTAGLSPVILSDEEIEQVLHTQLHLPCRPDAVHFYGSGVIPTVRERMESVLSRTLGVVEVHAESDMLGAARALYGRGQGMAAILGTGSNCCFYDGKNLIPGLPCLGYIIGDEGSGVEIGKRLIRLLFTSPDAFPLQRLFTEQTALDLPTIINKVYRQPFANRFLASLAPFALQQMQAADADLPDTSLSVARSLLKKAVEGVFADFHDRIYTLYNIYRDKGVWQPQPDAPQMPFGLIGSVAFHFRPYYEPLFLQDGCFRMQGVLGSPMEGLMAYHSVHP